MSSNREKKDIVSKLIILEEMLEPLQHLVADIKTLLVQGNSWIENVGEKTFTEMKLLLENKIDEFLRRSFTIASNGQKTFKDPTLTREQLNQASNFLSVDIASSRISVATKYDRLATQESQICQLTSEKDDLLRSMRIMEQDNKMLRTKYDQAIKRLQTRPEESVRLKVEPALAEDETLKKNTKEIVKLIKREDFLRCVQHVIKSKRALDDNGVRAFLSGSSGYTGPYHQLPLNRLDCINYFHRNCSWIGFTGTDLKCEITEGLKYLGLSQSEQDIFWDEYIQIQNI